MQVNVEIQGLLIPYEFYVINGLNHNVLIGRDFLQAPRCKLNLITETVSFYDDLSTLVLRLKRLCHKKLQQFYV